MTKSMKFWRMKVQKNNKRYLKYSFEWLMINVYFIIIHIIFFLFFVVLILHFFLYSVDFLKIKKNKMRIRSNKTCRLWFLRNISKRMKLKDNEEEKLKEKNRTDCIIHSEYSYHLLSVLTSYTIIFFFYHNFH